MFGLTVAGLSVGALAACLAVMYVGATVQGSIGIGMGMVSSPVLAIADSDFIPVAIVLCVIPLSGAVAWTERSDVDRRGLGFTLGGRVPGVILGALVTAALTDTVLALLVAGSVLVAVAVSISGTRFEVTDPTMIAAGFTSGFMATTTGVGGPPMALMYQHSDPVVMRSTISAYFTVGAVMSLIALALAGEVGRRQIELTATILPAVLAGSMTAHVLRDRLRAEVVRPAVLALCSASACALLAKTFL